jgi:hypothetical protein
VIDLERRRRDFEIATGQRIRFMVPFTPSEIWGLVLSMVLLGAILGYMGGLEASAYLRTLRCDEATP